MESARSTFVGGRCARIADHDLMMLALVDKFMWVGTLNAIYF